jgi:hypothetical protein
VSGTTIRSQSMPPLPRYREDPERFERQTGTRGQWAGSKNDPPTGNAYRCWRKICNLYRRPSGDYTFAKSGYDFATGAANYTRNAVGRVLSSPYGGAAALDYVSGNHTVTPDNHTGASTAGLSNLSTNASGAGSTGLSPAQLAALFGGVATVPAAAYGLYRGYGYMTRQPPLQMPPIPEVVPLNPMPAPRF